MFCVLLVSFQSFFSMYHSGMSSPGHFYGPGIAGASRVSHPVTGQNNYFRFMMISLVFLIMCVFIIPLTQGPDFNKLLVVSIAYAVLALGLILGFMMRMRLYGGKAGLKASIFIFLVEIGLLVCSVYILTMDWEFMATDFKHVWAYDMYDIMRWIVFAFLVLETLALALGLANFATLFFFSSHDFERSGGALEMSTSLPPPSPSPFAGVPFSLGGPIGGIAGYRRC